MIPMIIQVWCESGSGWASCLVPVTPDTTCRDVLDCCREPGDEPCLLLGLHPRSGVHLLKDGDRPLEVAMALGPEAHFVLKYVSTEAGSTDKSNGMKEPGSPEELLGEGVELTLGELRAMALRQQQQIDSQQQLLCAKEQRLRYLKQQEARQHQVALEGERLRRLRERVEAQELKLRKLRALRGQVDRNKQANAALTSDLESIRALFNEKEKELSVAVAKVEELTRQLEELRRGRVQPPPPSVHELDKLRRELMYRNKLNEQQNGRLSAQRAALGARQDEMRSIDRRVSELQARLLRKRALNRQLAAAHRHQPQRSSNPPQVQLSGYPANNPVNGQPKSQQARGNVAAVEPYNHIPHAQSVSQNQNFPVHKQNHPQSNVPLKPHIQSDNLNLQAIQQESHFIHQKQIMNPLFNNGGYHHLPPKLQELQYQQQLNIHEINTLNQVQQGISNAYMQNDHKMLLEHINKFGEYKQQYSPNSNSSSNSGQTSKEQKINEQEFPPEFAASKSDPKYQTLPYNTKFPTSPSKSQPDKGEEQAQLNGPITNINHMTVHSTPLSIVNKSLATPLNQGESSNTYQQEAYQLQKPDSSSKCSQNKENVTYQNTRPNQSSHSSGKSQVKDIKSTPSSSVNSSGFAIIRNTASGLSSGSSTFGLNSSQSLLLSPPQSASTPMSTPDVSGSDKSPKPALPPKPTIKTPPRQSAEPATDQNHVQTEISSDSDSQNQKEAQCNGNDMIIKARPLTIRKQPLSEQPKLRNFTNKNGISVSINRRIEMPPAFLFPEMDLALENDQQNILNNKLHEKSTKSSRDELDKVHLEEKDKVMDIAEQINSVDLNTNQGSNENLSRRSKKGNLKQAGKAPLARRVSFDPLALLLDASLEGELELVKKTATQVQNASAANDEGITALHNAICAGHFEIVKFLVELGCDVNAQDSDGWTPLHCAASCNNLPMVRFLVDNGACIFATTLSDHETAAEKCEEDEEGFDGCSEYLYSVQEKLGIMNGGVVYSVFAYNANRADELSFDVGARLQVLRKGDDNEREWWWAKDASDTEGYVPRNLLGLYPRVTPQLE